ncbi:hypothetical protein Bca52824_020733 [Brassica carinata]|uniref:Uncharacterized protein n=1 Tax=Brassica carinata TaxID=52824 RepID=A0A8X7VTV7_BRACI|nr:hypothetical protein Bca52824_020733 [Brassica carinata]
MLQDDEKHQKPPVTALLSALPENHHRSTTAVESKPVMIPFQTKQALIDEQISSVQASFQEIEKKKNKQLNDYALRNKARSYHNHQRPKSAMKAVFVDGLGGTGLLLPGSHGTVVESRKKSVKEGYLFYG